MAIITETGFLRLAQIIGCKTSKSKNSALIPISKSTWWAGVKSGRFPKPMKLGMRITVWKAKDIFDLIENGISSTVSAKQFPKEKIVKKNNQAQKKKLASNGRR